MTYILIHKCNDLCFNRITVVAMGRDGKNKVDQLDSYDSP